MVALRAELWGVWTVTWFQFFCGSLTALRAEFPPLRQKLRRACALMQKLWCDNRETAMLLGEFAALIVAAQGMEASDPCQTLRSMSTMTHVISAERSTKFITSSRATRQRCRNTHRCVLKRRTSFQNSCP